MQWLALFSRIKVPSQSGEYITDSPPHSNNWCSWQVTKNKRSTSKETMPGESQLSMKLVELMSHFKKRGGSLHVMTVRYWGT